MSGLNPTSTSLDPVNIPTNLGITTDEQKQVYKSALEFERFFVQQMLKPMENAGSMLGGSDDEGGAGAAGTSGYKDMAQDQLTQAVLDGGGLGIAATLYTQMAEAAGVIAKDATPAKGGDQA